MKQLGRAVLAVFFACACGGPKAGSDGGRDGQAVSIDGGGLDASPVTICSAASDCDDGAHCNGAERCEPGGAGAGADGCVPGTPPCATGETCDEAADRCVTGDCADPDADNDGHDRVACGSGDDCDDADGNRFPGNLEICDAAGHDEDCNPTTLGDRDMDTDGYLDLECCNGDVCGDDCDDSVGSVHPGVLDGCGAVDDDCDGMIDEDPDRTYYEDVDGDTYGVVSSTVMRCAAPVGFAVNSGDCNDANFNVHPAATEVCNGIDDNCDLTPDNPPTGSCACVDGTSQACGPTTDVGRCAYGTSTCVAGTWSECAGATLPAVEICNGEDDDCDGMADDMDADIAGSAPTATGATLYYRDMDGDGVGDSTMSVARCTPLAGRVTTPGDCDDDDSGIKPGAAETCDGVDQNCDGTADNRPGGCECVDTATRPCGTDEGQCTVGVETCVSGGWGSCSGVGPATEVCDGTNRDEDCDSRIDEGLRTIYYRDADNDTFGDRDAPLAACILPVGYADDPDDCNDDPATGAAIRPNATEICDAIDNNCDGTIDPGCGCTMGMTRPCGSDLGACVRGSQTCSTSGEWGSCNGETGPGTETCNGVDDDCDGTADEMLLAMGCYVDGDSDGYGSGSASTQCRDAARAAYGFCPVGYSQANGDCNDGNGAVRPMATETCNGVDDDCDGATDELVRLQFWRDADNDTYGNPALSVMACTAPAGYVGRAGDCDDTTIAARPGNVEAAYPCDGINNDCDTQTDEAGNNEVACYRDLDGDTYGAGTNNPACTCPSGWVSTPGDCDETGARAHLIHPNATFQTVGHCAGQEPCDSIVIGGGKACMQTAGCGLPGQPLCVCIQPTQWDYDCSGSVTPAPVGAACTPTGTLMCRNQRGPATPASTSACGTTVLHTGGCVTASLPTCVTRADSPALLGCR